MRPLDIRFWEKVDQSDGCWEWRGARNPDGYGLVWAGKSAGVHRVAWTLAFGAIPAGSEVLHRCDNRACVRPDHLFIGSQIDNIADMDAKHRRGRRGRPGVLHHNARLTEDDVRAIRGLCAQGLTHRSIAMQYGVSPATIDYIANRKLWRHI